MQLDCQALKARLEYANGQLIWRSIPATSRHEKTWNTKFSGKPAAHKIKDGTARIRFNFESYKAHRLVYQYFNGPFVGEIIHLNGDKLDNRIENLALEKGAVDSEDGLIGRIKELFTYVPETGDLIWNKTNTSSAIEKRINARYAGKVAGSINNKGYVAIILRRNKILAHRLVWALHHGYIPVEIDHINGVRSDNRIENLREVTHMENMKNSRMRIDNSSGITGVSWAKKDNKWRACIGHQGKVVLLGYFTDMDSAVKARKQAEMKYGYHENHGKPL